MSTKNRRKILFIYKPIQILFLKVVVVSCLLSTLAVLSASLLFYLFILNEFSVNQNQEMYQLVSLLDRYKAIYFTYVVAGFIFSLALMWYSWLKLSHKIAGPLFRIRQGLLHYLESGTQIFQPITLRKDDELQDLANCINAAVIKKSEEQK